MPGGQFTNLKFQSLTNGLGGEWGKVKDAYAAANRALGDIVKVGVGGRGCLCGCLWVGGWGWVGRTWVGGWKSSLLWRIGRTEGLGLLHAMVVVCIACIPRWDGSAAGPMPPGGSLESLWCSVSGTLNTYGRQKQIG
jgi:hypothetical protein